MITVRLFARLREELGCSVVELEAGTPTTASAVRTALAERHGPRWRELLLEGSEILVAVNQEIADWHSPVKSGDEVAFFPPVTGG